MTGKFAMLLLAALAHGYSPAYAAMEIQLSASCGDQLPQDTGQLLESALPSEPLRVLSWNIRKHRHHRWRDDLRQLAADADLVLLQEAVVEEAPNGLFDDSYFAVFSPGYRGNGYQSGVMTISRVSATAHCSLSHSEPWLGTPKAINIARFPIGERARQLLVVNLHGVNFSLAEDPLTRQLHDSGSLIEQHPGPVLFAGDFNTWSRARMAALEAVMERLALHPLPYPDDRRSQIFGNALDHVFVRGLRVLEVDSVPVNSSDHNPMQVTLALVQPNPEH